MEKIGKGSLDIQNTLLDVVYAEEMLRLTVMHDQMPQEVKLRIETELSERTLQALEWARDFMRNYERKHPEKAMREKTPR